MYYILYRLKFLNANDIFKAKLFPYQNDAVIGAIFCLLHPSSYNVKLIKQQSI